MYDIEDKKNWLHIYKTNNFNTTKTCEETGISESIVYIWIGSDKKELYFNDIDICTFKQAIRKKKDDMIDKAESVLDKALDANDTKVAMYVTSTLGKKRGYSEKMELDNKVEVKSNNSDFYQAVMAHIKKKKGE